MVTRRILIAIVFTAAGCDPCAGVAGCSSNPHVAATGQILDESTGLPVSRVAIDFVRTSGVALERDSVRTFTDDRGLFVVEVAALATGSVRGNIAVRPSQGSGYRVVDVDLETSRRRGEARSFRPWSTVPLLRDYAVIWLRGAPVQLASGVPIEFRQTGGVGVEGLIGGVFTTTTNQDGWAPLFGYLAQPVDAGDVIGDLTVFFPPPIGPKTRQNVRVRATPIFHKQLELIQLGVGPSLEYHIATNRRGRHGEPQSGVQIQFERTSGIQVSNPNWTSVTDGSGRVVFPGRPLESGTVIGTLRITPPAPWRAFDRAAQQFATFDEDGARLAMVVEVGPGIGGWVRVHANGAPVKGVEVEFRRTGGVPLDPSEFKAFSNDTGFVYLTGAASGEGEVTGDISVRPPAPYRSFTVRNVRVQAFDGEAPATPIIIGGWNLAQPPASSVLQRP